MLQAVWSSACCKVYSFYKQCRCWALAVDLRRSYSSLTFRSTSSVRDVSIAFACIFLALKVRLVPVSFEDPEFKSSFSQSFSLYVKYQMAIHQDPPDECGKTEVPFTKHFFLCWGCLWRSILYNLLMPFSLVEPFVKWSWWSLQGVFLNFCENEPYMWSF